MGFLVEPFFYLDHTENSFVNSLLLSSTTSVGYGYLFSQVSSVTLAITSELVLILAISDQLVIGSVMVTYHNIRSFFFLSACQPFFWVSYTDQLDLRIGYPRDDPCFPSMVCAQSWNLLVW